MGWICRCFGGKKERVRSIQGDGRISQKDEEKPIDEAPPPSLQSLGAHLKSAKEATAYEELFQPKQVVSGTAHGIKLFKRKLVRRAKSYGNNTSFDNGGRRFFDRNVEGRRVGRVDRLQEEVEALRKRLAEEEEEARKLRNEVCYLRSCGVLQSPDGHRKNLSLEKESLLPKDDRGQRNWNSWLGLTLSPGSRFRLDEHLRTMAADELSKVPGKGLTNGQKALIVATKLWQSQGDSNQDYQSTDELLNSSCPSDSSRFDSAGHILPTNGGEAISNHHHDNARACSDRQLPSKSQEPGNYLSGDDSCTSKTVELKSPPHSTSSELENFSFHPSSSDEKVTARHLLLADLPRRDVPLLQEISIPRFSYGSETEEMINPSPASPNRSSVLPNGGAIDSQTSDPADPSQARRFIDLRYQELEEKLLKSPTREKVPQKSTPENSPPRLSNGRQLDIVKESEQEDLFMSADVYFSEAQPALESQASSIAGDVSSPSIPVMTPFFAGKSGKVWQPLSPVREVDSAVSSSVEDLERKSFSQLNVSGSADSSPISDLKSSGGTILSGSEWEQQEGFPQHVDDMSEGPDDDLFTLSPRRLHHSYNPWDDVNRPDEGVDDSQKDSGSVADWASSEDADLDDFLPIQCQSPTFSPKQNSSNSKFSKEKALMVEYARDKYLKDLGLNVEEFLSSSDSCVSNKSGVSVEGNKDGTEIMQLPNMNRDSPGAGKENNDGIEILPVGSGQVIMAGPLKEASPVPKKSLIANDTTYSQEFDHPVLTSIENLPKWIECQGFPTSSLDNSQHQDTPVLETDEILSAQQDGRSGRQNFGSDSITDGELNDNEEEKTPKHKLAKEVDFGSCLQEPTNNLPTLEFSVRQDEPRYQRRYDLEGHEEARLRLSLHGFVYPDEQGLNLNHSRSMGNSVEKKGQDHHQNGTTSMLDELSYPGEQDKLGSLSSQSVKGVNETACLAELEEHQNVERVDSEYRASLDLQFSSGQQLQLSQELNNQQEVEKDRTVIVDSDFKRDVLSHVQSLGYSIQIPKLRDFSSFIEGAIESPGVCGGSEVSTATSRDRDEIFHDCESPTLSECNMESAECNFEAETNSVITNAMASRSGNAPEGVPARRILDISPDDRPILGTVATHWGETNDPKSLREWDGLGIPNSTSKFKEDQRVNWHTTPFETRLEQALAKLPVPDLSNQRNLFGGGNMV
ncbi:unnamed protein product [Calypogeia fissa]